jgi:hypothetical protein
MLNITKRTQFPSFMSQKQILARGRRSHLPLDSKTQFRSEPHTHTAVRAEMIVNQQLISNKSKIVVTISFYLPYTVLKASRFNLFTSFVLANQSLSNY